MRFNVRGMKVIFDFVLNHTSDEHPWFIESRQNKNTPKRVSIFARWKREKRQEIIPPNNWQVSSLICLAYDDTERFFLYENFL